MHPKELNYQKAKSALSPAEKVGQLFMPAAFINDTEAEIQQLEKLIREQQVGGLCFFHSRASAATNYEGKKKVVYNANSFETLKKLIQRYQVASKYPLLIAIDAEWGLAMRIENTPQYPYAITLGAIDGHLELIIEMGKNIAMDCKAAGIHWNLAPVVDINNNPHNPVIGYRSFGENRDNVTEKAIAYVKGMQHEGVLTSVKHFPGHGDTDTDSHLGLPLIDKSKTELLKNELYPFQKLIDEGVDSVMVGHLSVPALAQGSTIPSSVSNDIIKGMLRKEMGFKGVVISDALNMHAVSKNYPIKGELEWLAFDAGNDVLCFAEHIKEGIAQILTNAKYSQIEESFERVWKLKERAIAFATSQPNTSLSDPSILNGKLASESLTLFKGSAEDILAFQKQKIAAIAIGQNIENEFFNKILEQNQFQIEPISITTITALKNKLVGSDNILLAIFPRQIKPANHFGFSLEELALLNDLILGKNVVLYLFGNPYFLKYINTDSAKAVAVVYQNFDMFQQVAAQHFLGNFRARGKLPISIG